MSSIFVREKYSALKIKFINKQLVKSLNVVKYSSKLVDLMSLINSKHKLAELVYYEILISWLGLKINKTKSNSIKPYEISDNQNHQRI